MKPKQHLEFVKVDLKSGWEVPPGYPPGFFQKILASDLDEKAKKGSRTRLLKIEPGAFSTEPFVHDHWEEVYVIQGDLVVGNDKQGKGGQQCFAPTYACRPPGVHHGPFTSRGVAERGMGGDVVHALRADVHHAAVAQRLEVLSSGLEHSSESREGCSRCGK